jgi:hypothetical protein
MTWEGTVSDILRGGEFTTEIYCNKNKMVADLMGDSPQRFSIGFPGTDTVWELAGIITSYEQISHNWAEVTVKPYGAPTLDSPPEIRTAIRARTVSAPGISVDGVTGEIYECCAYCGGEELNKHNECWGCGSKERKEEWKPT